MNRLADMLSGIGNSKGNYILPDFPKLDANSPQSVFGASYDRVFQEMLSAPHK